MAFGDPGGTKLCRDADCFRHKRYGPIRVFFRASCSWRSEGLFGQSFSVALPIQAVTGLPCLGSFSIVQRIRHIEGPLAALQCIRCLLGQPLCCSAANASSVGRERLWLQPLHVTQQYHLASMAAWLSSTGISHHSLLPHIP